MAVGNREQPGGLAGVMTLLDALGRWPAPDQLFAEIQRLNCNMEKMHPVMDRLARAAEASNIQQLHTLALTLQNLNLPQAMKTAGDLAAVLGNLNSKFK